MQKAFAHSFFPILFSGLSYAAPPTVAPTTLPTGGQVVAGNATIQSSTTANTAVMNINQTSQRAVVNWDSFNVGKNATVNFNQPNANAVTLNRVTGGSASVIDGAIRANGQVILVNSNGITFGRGSEVNAAAVVASTLNIANQEFMDGKASFKDDGTGVGAKAGKIINKGTISTNQTSNESGEGGFIALLAPEVRNQGYLLAQKGGTVAIGSGSHITLHIQGQSLVAVKVEESVYNGLISNKRIIEAPGGLVVLATGAANQLMAGVIKNTGKISANALVSNGGTIELVAKTITQAGVISSNSQTKDGGQINLTGQEITLAKDSQTTASGATGGGQVNIGLANTQVTGGTQVNSKAPEAIKANADTAAQTQQLAKTVTIQENALIDASATQAGHGGAIAIWSELKTTVAGILKSLGGPLSGNGGFIETSSRGQVVLAPTTHINTSANNQTGKAGTWLLDPVDLLIDAPAASVISSVLSASNVTIAVTANTTACKAGFGSCVVSGSGNLTIAASIAKAGTAYTTLTLSSINSFTLMSNIMGQNLDVIITAPSVYLVSASRIEATRVTVQAQTILSNGVIQASNYYLLGSGPGSLGNAIELLAEAIFITSTLKINAGVPVDPGLLAGGPTDLNTTTYNVDLGLNKIYSSIAANDPLTSLVVTPAAQALSNAIYITATSSAAAVATVILEPTSQVLANGTTGGSIYLKASSIEARLGSLVRANGTISSGGMIGMKAENILIAGRVTADGFTDGGEIFLISTAGPLDLRDAVIQAIGSSGSSGSINAQAPGISSVLTSTAGSGVSSIDISKILFMRESSSSASEGSVNLGYEIVDSSGSIVSLGTSSAFSPGASAYANLAIGGTPSYFDGASAITSSIGTGTYSNLLVKGLFLTGADSGHFMLVSVPAVLTVSPAPVVNIITSASSASSGTSPLVIAPPPPPPAHIIFAPPPPPATANLQIAVALAPAPLAPRVAPQSGPSAAGGEAASPPPVHSSALTVMSDGTVALIPAAPLPVAARAGSPLASPSLASSPLASSPLAAPPAKSPPVAANRSAPSREGASNNPEGKKLGPSRDLADKQNTKDEPRKSGTGSTKYVSKYANGFRATEKPVAKVVAAKAVAGNKANPPREGKYSNRINAINNNSAVLAAMNQNPFAANISPFPPGVHYDAPTHIVLRGGDSLAQSYDDVPSIRNSGVANVGRSRASENFHASLESVNLVSTLHLFIIH